MAVARKADALIEAGGEGGERLRLHRVPLEAFSTMYSFYAALAGYEGEKWGRLASKADEDEVLSLRASGGCTVMHWAAYDDSRAKLAGVIAARDPGLVNAMNNFGHTPLHSAAMYGNEAVMQVLLAAGADTKAQDKEGCTALNCMIALRGNEAIVRALLAAGADPKATNNAGLTPLHFAARAGHEAVARALLAAGADKNAKDTDGDTPCATLNVWVTQIVATR